MISPSPTPPSSTPIVPAPRPPDQTTEQKKVKLTPVKKRAGQAPLALFVKAIFRPIFKGLYYLIRAMRRHKLAALIAAILLLGSIAFTSYALTGTVPLLGGGGQDAVDKSIRTNPQLSNDAKLWLLALRDGDINTLEDIQKSMPQSNRPPDTSLYLMQYSQAYAGVKWNSISVVGPVAATDKLTDAYVEVDMAPPPSVGGGTYVVLWHFAMFPDGHIFSLDRVSARLLQ